MARIEEDLMALRSKIDLAKREKDRLEGARKEQLRQLKEKYGVSDVKAGKKRLAEMETEIHDLEEELAAGIAKVNTALTKVEHGNGNTSDED